MDKVMIYGVYEFVGFHFCNRFLEKGYSVKGIHVPIGGSQQLEEKKLEVGRNANFEEVEMPDSEKLIDDNPAMIVSLYDFFMNYKESDWKQPAFFEKLASFINKRQEQIIFLLPVQLLLEPKETDRLLEMKGFLSQIKETASSSQFFYLPAVFGPWQSSSFLFQQSILPKEKINHELLEVKEWVWDAIYIDDALDTIIDIIEKGESGSYLIESGVTDSWGKCADLLKIDRSFRISSDLPITNSDEVTRVQVMKTTPYSEGLARQREHLSRKMDIDHFL